MKRKNTVSLVLGAAGGLMFALGMCMALIAEWNTFYEGIAVGAAGAIILLIMVLVRRVMSGKPAIRVNGKVLGRVLFGILGALVLGVGMCMTMLWEMMLPGIVVGIVGIVLLVCLIPLCKGRKEEKEDA